jgi:hypothetical protein
MRLFVPDIGTLIQLKENYTFTLYGEGRNRKLYDALGIRYPNVTVVELPKGLILKIDRVYIRKGQSSFSSITFSVPKPKSKVDKLERPDNVRLCGAKFWVKLHECNEMEMDLVTSNEETVNAIKELYNDIEKELIESDKSSNIYNSTKLLTIFNRYLGPGLNINNLHTNQPLDIFLQRMISRMEKDNEKGKEYFESKFKVYLRDFKIRKIME